MEEFKLYQSGIHYSNVYIGEYEVLHERLNLDNNKFNFKSVLSEKGNELYIENFKINILEIKNKISNYKKVFEKNYEINEKIITEYNEEYSKLDEYTYVQRKKKFPLDIIVVNNELVGFICISEESATVLVKEGYEDYSPLK
ncbi:hypothetical protein [Faecalimicrobium dakarense]|uniref:hypothetical protein n=1 Tax=Faecalimicrobium dakarense TaxID=1301100 RepID=UPI0004B57851|nr:hypothetical protein [[Clostridium] dakarense]